MPPFRLYLASAVGIIGKRFPGKLRVGGNAYAVDQRSAYAVAVFKRVFFIVSLITFSPAAN